MQYKDLITNNVIITVIEVSTGRQKKLFKAGPKTN
jgi:hypothetical protein